MSNAVDLFRCISFTSGTRVDHQPLFAGVSILCEDIELTFVMQNHLHRNTTAVDSGAIMFDSEGGIKSFRSTVEFGAHD